MEIIKRGTPPEDREYEGTCTDCRTEVRFKQSEASSSNDPREGPLYFVGCPVCIKGTIFGTHVPPRPKTVPKANQSWEGW